MVLDVALDVNTAIIFLFEQRYMFAGVMTFVVARNLDLFLLFAVWFSMQTCPQDPFLFLEN